MLSNIHLFADLYSAGVIVPNNNLLTNALEEVMHEMRQGNVHHPGRFIQTLRNLTGLFPANVCHPAGDVFVSLLQTFNIVPNTFASIRETTTCRICGPRGPPTNSDILMLSSPPHVPGQAPINLDNLVNDLLQNGRHSDCVHCGAQGSEHITFQLSRPNSYLMVELESRPNAAVSRLTFAQTPGSILGEPFFVLGYVPGHWLGYSRHPVTNHFFKLDDWRQPVPKDPFNDRPVWGGPNVRPMYVVFKTI